MLNVKKKKKPDRGVITYYVYVSYFLLKNEDDKNRMEYSSRRPVTLYLMRTGWTVLPGRKPPGLKVIKAFLYSN